VWRVIADQFNVIALWLRRDESRALSGHSRRIRRPNEISTEWLKIGIAPVAALIVSHFGFSFGFHNFETRTSCSATKHAVVNFNF
jgi:hypothetical protein